MQLVGSFCYVYVGLGMLMLGAVVCCVDMV